MHSMHGMQGVRHRDAHARHGVAAARVGGGGGGRHEAAEAAARGGKRQQGQHAELRDTRLTIRSVKSRFLAYSTIFLSGYPCRL